MIPNYAKLSSEVSPRHDKVKVYVFPSHYKGSYKERRTNGESLF